MRRLAAILAAALAACSDGGDAPPPPLPPPGPGACELETPGAPWLTFASQRTGTYDLFLTRADGTCLRPITTGSASDLYPSFGPGWRIAYRSAGAGGIVLRMHDLETAQDWPIQVGTLTVTSPALSPDGTKLAFEAHTPESIAPDIYLVATTGGDPVQLTTHAAADAGPAWSPDGTRLYFVSTRNNQYDVYWVPAYGGTVTRVTTGSGITGKPAVSPDGLALYYTRVVGGSAQVVRHTLATGTTAVVTSQSDSEPALSPGGDRLAVRSFRDGRANLWVVGALDGADPVQLTTDLASDGAPSFAPALATTAAP